MQKIIKFISPSVVLFLVGITDTRAYQKITLEYLVPYAPNAAELGKHGAYPIGMLTGIPEISFPLYEISSGNLKLLQEKLRTLKSKLDSLVQQ